jgi:hypothetical protein
MNMAKALVKKSKKGNDLVELTLGPRETAKLLCLLETAPDDVATEEIYTALCGAQDKTSNKKSYCIESTAKFQEWKDDYDFDTTL